MEVVAEREVLIQELEDMLRFVMPVTYRLKLFHLISIIMELSNIKTNTVHFQELKSIKLFDFLLKPKNPKVGIKLSFII